MLLRIWMLLIALLLGPAGHGQSLALSFDDGFDPRVQPQAAQWNQALLDALARAGVKALLLPAAGRVESSDGMKLVRQWGAAGHVIGNHSYSHLNLAAEGISAQAFTADIAKAERVLSGVEGWQRLFRYPYLKEGTTAQVRDAVRQWLAAHGYQVAAVSIDTSDWYYNKRFLTAQSIAPGRCLAAYRTAYLEHLWSRAQYYDGLAKQLLGRSAPHLILLHTNAINASFLNDVIDMFKSRGWDIVEPGQALADPLYASRTTGLPAGESILWALAKERGRSALRYPAEDGVYEAASIDRADTCLTATRDQDSH